MTHHHFKAQLGNENRLGLLSEAKNGLTHIHNGIHGKADLAPDTYTSNGPVAIIRVKRVGK